MRADGGGERLRAERRLVVIPFPKSSPILLQAICTQYGLTVGATVAHTHNGHRIQPHIAASILETGVCMSAYIFNKVDETDLDVLEQLEEMNQMFQSKFNYEKDKLERKTRATVRASVSYSISSCCVLNSDIICTTSAMSCWLDTRPLNDYTSFFPYMDLFQELSIVFLLDGMELQSVYLICMASWSLEIFTDLFVTASN